MKWCCSLVGAAIGLAGCASFSPDGGFDTVARMTEERTGQRPAYQRTADDARVAQARVAELVSQPLTAEGAVEIALRNNPALQADFAELGIAEADWVQAGRLRNPSFSFGRLSGGGMVEIDRAVMFDVLSWLTRPMARQMEQAHFEQVQQRAAMQAVGLAGEAKQAFWGAVAARQLVAYFQQVREAADASSELARRMQQAGNFNALAQMREQAFQTEAVARLARARHQSVVAQERLARALGWEGDPAALPLVDRLPDLPAQPTLSPDAEQMAMDRRLDVQMAKRSTQALAGSLGLTRATRLVNVLQVGYQNQSDTGGPRRDGYEIELVLPLFDFGTTRVARAEALYMQSLHRTAQVALTARSQVRQAYSAYLTAFELARHYQQDVLPMRKRMSAETLLRYNGMLSSVFDLLADAREQIVSVTAAVEALRDHWVAQTNLQLALTAGGSSIDLESFESMNK